MWPWAAFDQSLQNDITGSEGWVADWNIMKAALEEVGQGRLTVMGSPPGSTASVTRDAKCDHNLKVNPSSTVLSSSHSPCAHTTQMGALMPSAPNELTAPMPAYSSPLTSCSAASVSPTHKHRTLSGHLASSCSLRPQGDSIISAWPLRHLLFQEELAS